MFIDLFLVEAAYRTKVNYFSKSGTLGFRCSSTLTSKRFVCHSGRGRCCFWQPNHFHAEAKKGGLKPPPVYKSTRFGPRGLHELARISSGQRVKERYDLLNLLRRKLLAKLILRHLGHRFFEGLDASIVEVGAGLSYVT